MRKIHLLFTAGVFSCLLLTACGQASYSPGTIITQNDSDHVISVSSREEVKVVPDIAEITYSVYTEGDTPDACQTKNSQDVEQVINVLKELGIEETSIQTSGYGLQPQYDWSQNTQKLIGYSVNTTITVSDVPIDKAGDIMSKSVTAGVNTIDSVEYKSSQFDESYQQALNLAIQTAKEKAVSMAETGGCELGSIVGIEELSSSQEPRYTNNQMAKQIEEAAYDTGSAKIMPGQVGVEAQVTVKFQIK